MHTPSSTTTGPRSREIDRSGGYAATAFWIAQDVDYETYIFRRFDWLTAHSILCMQTELMELEARLQKFYLDARTDMDMAQLGRQYCASGLDAKSIEKERNDLIKNIQDKLKTYHEMLLRHSEIAKLNRPRSRVLNLFRTWFNGDEKARRHVPWAPDNYGKPDPVLDGVAQTALDDQADLAALGAAPSQDLLSKLLVNYWLGGRRNATGDAKHFEQRKVHFAVAVISILLSAALLVGSITSLHYVTSSKARLGMISGFSILFAVSVGLLSNASRSEVYAATAAYAAVLVVFVSGNLGDCSCPASESVS